MQTQTLKAEKRKVLGRKVKALRAVGVLPANVYGKKVKSQAVQVDAKDFNKVFEKTGETGLIELVLDNKKRVVLVHNVQVDPVTDIAVHADFLQVDLKTKVTAQVPVELSGEPPAEKEGKGTVVQYVDEIEVEALPADLLEKFEVDLSQLSEVDQAIKVGDLKVDAVRVEVKNDAEQTIVKVEPPRKREEEVKPEEETGGEVEEKETEIPEGEKKVEAEQKKELEGEKAAGAEKSEEKGKKKDK